jgi:CheY-like chemotaxis protein
MGHAELPELRGTRVLVVDDDADTREMLATILESSGAVVVTADSAADALAACAKALPDVLISDIGLPGEDGFSLMKQLRALPPSLGGDVPAIALTGYDSDPQGEAGSVFRERLIKPVALDEVVAAVARALQARSSIDGQTDGAPSDPPARLAR